MRYLVILFTAIILFSCWGKINPSPYPGQSGAKVWGYKPIYGVDSLAKKIGYKNVPQPVAFAGNIYVLGDYIFQLELGKGIHVISNTDPALAKRIGFITVNGSSQISIKNNYLYTNSYDDLVVIDIADVKNVTEVKRVKGAFPEGRLNYFYSSPPETGYYECPSYDSAAVIGWRKDSIWQSCYKN